MDTADRPGPLVPADGAQAVTLCALPTDLSAGAAPSPRTVTLRAGELVTVLLDSFVALYREQLAGATNPATVKAPACAPSLSQQDVNGLTAASEARDDIAGNRGGADAFAPSALIEVTTCRYAVASGKLQLANQHSQRTTWNPSANCSTTPRPSATRRTATVRRPSRTSAIATSRRRSASSTSSGSPMRPAPSARCGSPVRPARRSAVREWAAWCRCRNSSAKLDHWLA